MEKLIDFKYQKAVNQALAYIDSHKLQPGDRLPSERRFAEALDVGRPTVNKAIACLIAEGRLRREGYKLYVASPAHAPASDTLSIAVLCSHPLRQRKVATHNLVEAAYDICELLKVRFTPLLSANGIQQREQLVDLLKNENRLDGIVIWPHPDGYYSDLLKQFAARGIPVVTNDLDLGPFDFVSIDNYHGIQLSMEHLVEQGHREISYFTRPLTQPNLVERRNSFEYAAFRLLGERVRCRIYEEDEREEESLQELFLKFQKESPRATAICCSHDFVALELIRICQQHKVKIPEDLSIIGFDGIDAAAISIPPLTTVAQNFYQMGAIAVELLIRRIRLHLGEHALIPQKVRLGPTLVIRQSTTAPCVTGRRRRRKNGD